MSLTDLKAGTQYNASWVNNAGNASYNGTGPRVLDLLNKAGLLSSALNITFLASDGYTSNMTLADLNGKYNATIIAYDWSGMDRNGVKLTYDNTLQVIVPAGGGNNQAKKLVQITVS